MHRGLFFLYIMTFTLPSWAQEKDMPIQLDELDVRIARLVDVNDIPAFGLALIDDQGNRLSKSFGFANLEGQIPATAESMYRLGSVSKMFAALAILKLQDQGKLRLSDHVRALVPEITFTNRWAESHPVQVQHLLNHTTGWDDFHGIEWTSNDPKPLTTREGLDLHPHTRISRWPPGTRMSYSNIGAPVAAYIVEKLSGMPYEKFIEEQFFVPMGLETTTFFNSSDFQEFGVTNYHKGQPLNYYHVSGRAAGALNSSPRELLIVLDLFLNRGIVDSAQIISTSSIRQMENLFPEFGLQSGYSLCNLSNNYKGFQFKGHNGAIDNALATLYYLPEHKVGYALMASTMNNRDFRKINELVTDYLIQNFHAEKQLVESKPASHNPEIEGFYYFASPRNQKFRVIKNLFEPARVKWQEDTLYFGPAFGKSTEAFVAVGENKYGTPKTNRQIHLAKDYDDSMILYKSAFGGGQAFKPISGLLVYGRIMVFGLALVLSFVTSAIAFIQLVRLILGNIKINKEAVLGIGPAICSLVLLPTIVLFLYLMNHPFEHLFYRDSLTMTLFGLTIIYGLSALWSVIFFGRYWQQIGHNAMNIYLAIVALTHFVLAVYLFSQDMIGIQTWA